MLKKLCISLVTSLCLSTACISSEVEAQQGNCVSYTAGIDNLEQRYNEHRRWIGLDGKGSAVILFTDDEGEHFTIAVLVSSTEQLCYIGAGFQNSFTSPVNRDEKG